MNIYLIKWEGIKSIYVLIMKFFVILKIVIIRGYF